MAEGTVSRTPLRVLIVEDNAFDAQVLINTLRQGGYDPHSRRVDTGPAMAAALAGQTWDVIISDFTMPDFTMAEALRLVQQSGLDIPFIIVSGGIGEDVAVAAMKAGAHDYLMKGSLARLAPAVAREIREAAVRAARRQAETSLRESELRYRTLWETSTDAVILADSEGLIQFANPAAEKVFGYGLEEIIGHPLSILQPEASEVSGAICFQVFLQPNSKAPQSLTEISGRHKEGRGLILEVAFNEIELHQSPWKVLFIRDITERRANEETLRENREQFRVAREIQQRLFPKAAPVVEAFDIAGASFPADATGGDYFDFPPMLDGGIGVAIGDVSGHGIGPALLMSETRAYIRIVAHHRRDLAEILTFVNRILAEDVSYERFVTLFLAKLDASSQTLQYANAGHPSGYVLDGAGEIKSRLKRTGIPLGLQPEARYEMGAVVKLEPGDLILLSTDGIEEAVSPSGEFFDAERMVASVRRHRQLPAAQIIEALYQEVRAFAGQAPQLDDITMVIVKVNAVPGASPVAS
jgi:PAS domain S-box-containing protein